MSDLPILKQTTTFTDEEEETSLCDVELDGFLSNNDIDVNELDPMVGLKLLNDTVVVLLKESKATFSLPSPGLSSYGNVCGESDNACSDENSNLSNEADINEYPLSPRKTHRQLSNDQTILEIDKNRQTLAQNEILSKRFSLTSDPAINSTQYLERINKYCKYSTAVYITACYYIFKIIKVHKVMLLTNLNVHRLLITAIRLSCKTVEDINHNQPFVAKIGGISTKDLLFLEISLLFLLKFECQVDPIKLNSFLNDLKKIVYLK